MYTKYSNLTVHYSASKTFHRMSDKMLLVIIT